MKRVAMAVALMLIAGQAFAGAVDPCRMTAYQYCANNLKVKAVGLGPDGQPYCTVNPSSATFKACETDARARCKSGVVLDLTPKAC